MNEKQKELLLKKFKISKDFDIKRIDYESMPDPMLAWNWTDAQMEELAKSIAPLLDDYNNYDNEDEAEEDFWREMENAAVRMGMEYYEDMDVRRIQELNKQFDNIK